MNSVVVRTAWNALLPILLVTAVFLLLRGHNEPGGGFVGGLVAAAALALPGTRRPSWVPPADLCLSLGLALALASALFALAVGQPLMLAFWGEVEGVALGTPLLFDVGVFFVVLGFASGSIAALRKGT